MSRPENPDFERWFYRWKRPEISLFGGPAPGGTVLLYRVCGDDTPKFDLALDLLQDAFEAGIEAGRTKATGEETPHTGTPRG